MNSPWPAPSGAPLIESSPSRRRRRWPLVMAVVAVLAVAGGVAAMVATRDDTDPTIATPADAALRAAFERLDTERFVSYRLTVGAVGSAFEADVLYDTASGILRMTLSGDDLPVRTEMLLDSKGQTMYMDVGALGFLGTSEWVVFDLGALADLTGMPVGGLDGLGFADPFDISRLLTLASEVREVGVENVGGVQLRHLQVVLDTADVTDAPDAVLDELPPELRALVDGLPSSLTFDVWVTADDELRRLAFEAPSPADLGSPISIDMTITPTADAVPPTLPPPADTVDFFELLESFDLGDVLDDAFSG